MRKVGIALILIVAGLYTALHVVLGSRPVQQRLLDEVQKALLEFGVQLDVESVEFATFTPKLYFNRVTISTTKKAVVQIKVPVTIDKIKIQIQPLALIKKEISISDAVLFNPKVNIPRADNLYKVLAKQFKQKKPVAAKGGDFTLVLHRVGIVDALFNVSSKDPDISIRSNSLTTFVGIGRGNEQSISVESSDLQIVRGPNAFQLTKADVDLRIQEKYVIVRRAILEGEDFAIDVEGRSALPIVKKGKGPSEVSAQYSVQVPMKLLKKIPELKMPNAKGKILSSGSIKHSKEGYSGSGGVRYEKFDIDGYQIGKGSFDYSLRKNKLTVSDVALYYGGGVVRSDKLNMNIDKPIQISGSLSLDDVELEGILDSVKASEAPVKLGITGKADVSGQLMDPFRVDLDFNLGLKDFSVVNDYARGVVPDNTIVSFKEGQVEGRFSFLSDRMEYGGELSVLGGKADVQGYMEFDDSDAIIEVDAKKVSLTELATIAEIPFAGEADLKAVLDFTTSDPKISGNFSVEGAEISNLVLGKVTGEASYLQNLLKFSRLQMLTDLEPAWGSGVVDFNPEKTSYEFKVGARRIRVDRAFRLFEKRPLGFEIPQGGEVGVECIIFGGGKHDGLQAKISGEVRNVKWFEERWVSSRFSLSYSEKLTELHRLLLRKRRGNLRVAGKFTEAENTMWISTEGLPVQELDRVGDAPIKGLLKGDLRIRGNFNSPAIWGKVDWVQASFRNNPLGNSHIDIETKNKRTELFGNVNGQKLRGQWVRKIGSDDPWEVLLHFNRFDIAPLLTLSMGKDVPTLSEILATGDLKLEGQSAQWKSFRGSGTLNKLIVGQKGAPMQSSDPVQFKVANGAVTVDRFHLIGTDSQLSFDLKYEPEKFIQSDFDGKVDLRFLQPFIPGLAYGTGKVSLGLRLSGHPDSFDLFGNMRLEDGNFRLLGLNDEFRNTQAQFSMSHNRVNVDKFKSNFNGGTVNVEGDVRIARFQRLIPNLRVSAYRIGMQIQPELNARFTGEFSIAGENPPYLFSGTCEVHEANLTSFDMKRSSSQTEGESPLFKYDIGCAAPNRLRVKTDLMNSEFKGNLQIKGNSEQVGLLGALDIVKGDLYFRDETFEINRANVQFESPNQINPRFDVSASSLVRERNAQVPQEYEVTLIAIGTPEDYKIHLTSNPALSENELISLLVFGVTGTGAEDDQGNLLDLGTAIVGQVPIQKKLENELGLKIGLGSQSTKSVGGEASSATSSDATAETDKVASVSVQKDITDKTTLSFSNTIQGPLLKEIRIEQLLSDKFSVNGSVVDKRKATTTEDTVQTYGLDVRYRFQFE